jgi:hypothetical protein
MPPSETQSKSDTIDVEPHETATVQLLPSLVDSILGGAKESRGAALRGSTAVINDDLLAGFFRFAVKLIRGSPTLRETKRKETV